MRLEQDRDMPAFESIGYTDLTNVAPAPASEEKAMWEPSDGLMGHLPATGDLPGLAPGAPVTKALPGVFATEEKDASAFRGGNRAGIDNVWSKNANQEGTRFTEVSTKYFKTPEEQAAHEGSVQDGKILNAQGEALDTSGASGIGTMYGEGKGKHIFAISEDDKLRTADPWGEHGERPIANAPNEAHLDMINHSSLVAGGKVKAAGDLTVDDGKLVQVSDQSGHYTPNGEMVHQALDHFEQGGVDLHDTSVKLVKKSGDQKNLHASAREFQAVESAMRKANADAEANGEAPKHDLAATDGPGKNPVEQFMRDRREEVKDELKDALKSRKERAERGEMKVAGETVEASAEMKDWAQSTKDDGSVKAAAVGDGKVVVPPRGWQNLGPLPDRPAPQGPAPTGEYVSDLQAVQAPAVQAAQPGEYIDLLAPPAVQAAPPTLQYVELPASLARQAPQPTGEYVGDLQAAEAHASGYGVPVPVSQTSAADGYGVPVPANAYASPHMPFDGMYS